MNSEVNNGWISANQSPPIAGVDVLVTYKNEYGKWITFVGYWIPSKFMEASLDSDIAEYDEETDRYYDPAGWYERTYHWGAYFAVGVPDDVREMYWQLLPEPPIVE